MTKRVLIFFPHALKQRHGGPYSMLYHLQKGLRAFGGHRVEFLSSLVSFEANEQQPANSSYSLFRHVAKQLLPMRWMLHYRIRQWLSVVDNIDGRIARQVHLSQYDVIHFHETVDVWRYRRLLENFKGAVVLTSHSPKPYHLELLEDVMGTTKNALHKTDYEKIEAIDRFAYAKATHLIFPCVEATEAYYQTWPVFQKLSEKKLSFVPTGVIASSAVQPGEAVRQQLCIPADAFVVTFIGRKLAVKGYDLLVKAAASLLHAHPDFYFVIVGKESSDPSFAHPRWIETGWTNDPFSYVLSSDLHVVPNRCTNFDLNVLEVLSLGKPLLLSKTGGNQFFQKYNSDGLFFHYPDAENLAQEIVTLYERRKELPVLGGTNAALYEKHFTAERFAADQLAFYNSIHT